MGFGFGVFLGGRGYIRTSLLPFLGLFFVRGQSIVLGDVSVEGADKDHGDHEGQEQHDQHAVHDGEPVHLVGNCVVH